jgi:hypothetical protein
VSHPAHPDSAEQPGSGCTGGAHDPMCPLAGRYDPLTGSADLLDALMWVAITGSSAARPPIPATRVVARPRPVRPAGRRAGSERPLTPSRPGQARRGRAWSRWIGLGDA